MTTATKTTTAATGEEMSYSAMCNAGMTVDEMRKQGAKEDIEAGKDLPRIANLAQRAQYPYSVFETGDKAHVKHYTDITPGTVVDVKRNGREVTIQNDDYKLKAGQKLDVSVGGFMGHVNNQRSLEFDFTRNEEGHFTIFTLRNWRGRYCWTIKGTTPDGRQAIGKGWRAFYDYNF